MKRQIVIGDIHGALKALKQLLQKIKIQKDDQLIFLGDYVDGWPESAAVIEYLISLDTQHDCIFLKGNHDIWCEWWLAGQVPDEDWLIHGGKPTIASYADYSTDKKKAHLGFFNRMKNYYIDTAVNNLFIHAGFSSMHGPEKEHYQSNCSWDRTLWEVALAVDKHLKKEASQYPKRLLLYSEIYIGHTPTTNYDVDVPMQACNVWNIDTGAAFRGKLSAIEVKTKKIWQSDTVQKLYPNDKGRNR
jgi:serine/threonine protein phosphatase 1